LGNQHSSDGLWIAGRIVACYAASSRTGQIAENRTVELRFDGVSLYPTYRKPFDLIFRKGKNEGMVRPERFELPTYSSGGCRSIQLSYGRAPD
jgi:hypothetical protein